MPIIFPFEEDDDCATRILLFVFVLIVVADKLKEKKGTTKKILRIEVIV